MRKPRSHTALPLPVGRGLRQLGEDISVARRRRRINTTLMAQRAFITRNTLRRVEMGDPGVSMGIYATVLFVLGLADRLALLAGAAGDPVGQTLAIDQLPKRIRTSAPH